MARRNSRASVETTIRLRRIALERGDTTTCLGCGKHPLPPGPAAPGKGISRWNPKATLCSECCTFEALSGRTDPFGLAVLPGGRNHDIIPCGTCGPCKEKSGLCARNPRAPEGP